MTTTEALSLDSLQAKIFRWFITAGLGITIAGAAWATRMYASVQSLQTDVQEAKTVKVQVDSLRIEFRHTSDDVRDIKRLLQEPRRR